MRCVCVRYVRMQGVCVCDIHVSEVCKDVSVRCVRMWCVKMQGVCVGVRW